MTLLAKSDGTTLEDHTLHVVRAVEAIGMSLVPEMTKVQYGIAIHAAVLHDLGKAHPIFQESLIPDFDRKKYENDVPHRHELSSLLFLPLFNREEWPQLVDMVVAHHKSLRTLSSKPGRGLLDLVDRYGDDEVYKRHSDRWEDWHTGVNPILVRFDIPICPLGQEAIRSAFDEAIRLCEQTRFRRSQWRGLLMSADHLASALQEETEVRVERLFQAPDLTAFHDRASAAAPELFPLAKKSIESAKPHTLVVAPTGSGKTDLLMRRSQQGRVFYLLPFQASINAMYLRFERLLNGPKDKRLPLEERTDIRRVHAAAQIDMEDDLEEETLLQRHPGAALKVMTPHQIAALIFGLSGHEAVALDVAGQNVILDEVHVYNEQTQAMVLELIKALIRIHCRIHIGSATIPSALTKEIRLCLGGDENIYEVRLSPAELETYDRHTVLRLNGEDDAKEFIRTQVELGMRVLFISNRVATAQQRFEWARQTFPGVPVLLVHSRFRRVDRARLERKIDVFEKATGPCIVCSTQVIEVSLDISFDTLVTDCAPLDSLIQRFGRVNRRRVKESERTFPPVAVIKPPASNSAAKPYDLDVMLRTWAVLPENDILHETELQHLIDFVYPTIDLKAIDVHLIEVDGARKLPELCNLPRCLLLEVLEIDSAVVIREADLEDYRHSLWENRQKLEIPLPVPTLRPKFKLWAHIDIGSKPFVCPDECYDEHLGLMLGEEREPKCIIL